jgi:hypothetical protein
MKELKTSNGRVQETGDYYSKTILKKHVLNE